MDLPASSTRLIFGTLLLALCAGAVNGTSSCRYKTPPQQWSVLRELAMQHGKRLTVWVIGVLSLVVCVGGSHLCAAEGDNLDADPAPVALAEDADTSEGSAASTDEEIIMEASLSELVVRLNESTNGAQDEAGLWSVTVIEHLRSVMDEAPSDAAPRLGQSLLLKLQVPNARLGEPGGLSKVVVQALDVAQDPALWQVIGLPEVIALPAGGDAPTVMDEETFAGTLAAALEAQSPEMLDEPEVQPEVVPEPEQPAVVLPETAEDAPIEPSVPAVDIVPPPPQVPTVTAPQPQAPPLPPVVVSTGEVLGGTEPLLIEYSGALRIGAAEVRVAGAEGLAQQVMVDNIDGRFALIRAASFAPGVAIELRQDGAP